MKRVALFFAILIVALTQQANATTYTIVDGTNVGAAPDTYDLWNVADVGWLYTPTTPPYSEGTTGTSYTIDDIGTAFGTSSSAPVTVDVYEESSLPSEIGTLIATGTLDAVANTMEYATLTPEGPEAGSSQVSLTVGDTYFVELLNVTGLGENVDLSEGATSVGNWYLSNGDGIQGGSNTTFRSAPILAFATATVPEPSTWALLVASVVGLVYFRRFRFAAVRR